MRFLPKFGCCKSSTEEAMVTTAPQDVVHSIEDGEEAEAGAETHILRTLGWISAALGAVALGLIVGSELRQRYKFNRRTPYDMYSHSGDELPDVDFGVGI